MGTPKVGQMFFLKAAFLAVCAALFAVVQSSDESLGDYPPAAAGSGAAPPSTDPMRTLTPVQYDIIYNVTSLGLASMMASTVFFFLRMSSFSERYKAALCFTGLVTFIAAYRYVDWFLTVPLLLIEIVLVMKLSEAETFSQSLKLGAFSALMILNGYPGEVSSNAGTRWVFWFLSMLPFCYIVYTLFVGLKASQEAQPEECKDQVKWACWATVISWCTYPIVFILPMLSGNANGGTSGMGAGATVMIQVGYTASDIISKCGVGYLVYRIGLTKSMMDKASAGYEPTEDNSSVGV